MGRIGKAFALTLILIIAISSLLLIKSANAQTTSYSIPSIPEFSTVVTDTSYNVPPTYSNDPTTGQMVINSSYYSGSVSALNVTLTIKNQPLVYFNNTDMINSLFTYFIQVKPHNSTTWTDLSGYYGVKPSSGDYTTISFQFSNPYFFGFPTDNPTYYLYPHFSNGLTYANGDYYYSQQQQTLFIPITIPNGEQVDFRVQAGMGEITPLTYGPLFDGNLSNWNTLTISLLNGQTASASANPSVSPTPTVPELSVLAIVPLLLSLLCVAGTVRHRKDRKVF